MDLGNALRTMNDPLASEETRETARSVVSRIRSLNALVTEFHTGLIDGETFVERAAAIGATNKEIQEAIDGPQ